MGQSKNTKKLQNQDPKKEPNELLRLLEHLYKLAATGHNYAGNPYDLLRYAEIKETTKKMYEQIPGFEALQLSAGTETDYITPKVGVNAIIVNEAGEYLIERRSDDKSWGMVGGWCEQSLTAEENILREVKEETGYDAEIVGLLAVFSRTPTRSFLHTSCHIIYHCRIIGGQLECSHESEEVAWKKLEDIDVWHFDHESWMMKSVALLAEQKM